MTLLTMLTVYIIGSALVIALFRAESRHRERAQQYFEDSEQARYLSARSAGKELAPSSRTASVTSTRA